MDGDDPQWISGFWKFAQLLKHLILYLNFDAASFSCYWHISPTLCQAIPSQSMRYGTIQQKSVLNCNTFLLSLLVAATDFFFQFLAKKFQESDEDNFVIIDFFNTQCMSKYIDAVIVKIKSQ